MMGVYRVIVIPHTSPTPCHGTDLFIPPTAAAGVESLTAHITSSSSSPTPTPTHSRWTTPPTHPECVLGIGAGSEGIVYVICGTNGYPPARLAALLASALDDDPSLLARKNAFRARVAFEALPLYAHAIPEFVGSQMRVKPRDAELAQALDPLVDGTTSVGTIVALHAGLLTRSWSSAPSPLPDHDVEALYPGLRTRAHVPPDLVECVGNVILFLARYSWLRTPKRVRRSGVLPFVTIANAVHPHDVFRHSVALAPHPGLSDEIEERIREAAASSSPPVTAAAAELVYSKFDGFLSLAEVCSATPLPSSLTRAIAAALFDQSLLQRSILVPHALRHHPSRIHTLPARESWTSWASRILGLQSTATKRAALLARVAPYFDGNWTLEHISLFSGVSLDVLIPLGWQNGMAFERLTLGASLASGLTAYKAGPSLSLSHSLLPSSPPTRSRAWSQTRRSTTPFSQPSHSQHPPSHSERSPLLPHQSHHTPSSSQPQSFIW